MSGPWDNPASGARGNAANGRPRALNCSACGAPIVVRAAGVSVSVICGNCGSTLDATDPALGLIHQSAEALARPEIPLGTRGVLAGVEWEAVGYLERSGDGAQWQEYLLFNPWEGYRFLVYVDGDWRLGQGLDRLPEVVPGTAMLDGQAYEGGEGYDARVDFVVGEFYWRVAVGETVTASEYDGRGASLSREANGAEVSWTRLQDLPRGAVAKAFGLAPLPDAGGKDGASGRLLFFSLAIAGLAMAALLIALLAKPSATQVAEDSFLVEFGAPATTHVIGPVAQARASSAIRVKATTGVANAWVELDFALVERRSQRRFEASTTAEYYTGRDSDGRWSEGDPAPDVIFSSIPRGTYDLIVAARALRWSQGQATPSGYDVFGRPRSELSPQAIPPAAVTIVIARDASFGSSFVLATLAILVWPAWLGWRHFSRRQRDHDR